MEFGQVAPQKNDLPASWDLVIDDLNGNLDLTKPFADVYHEIIALSAKIKILMELRDGNHGYTIQKAIFDLAKIGEERDNFGFKKYGTRLQPNNGRDNLSDCLEEALDLMVYFKTFQYEFECNRAKKVNS